MNGFLFPVKRIVKSQPALATLTVILFAIALSIRLFRTDIFPAAFSHDELNYLINSLSIAWSGWGKTGDWSPLSLTPVEPTLAELPAVFIAPFFYLPFSWSVAARVPFLLMGLTIPVWVALISYRITKSSTAAYMSWVLALFNPWLWQMSRLTFDSVFSLWFYLLGIAIYLSSSGKKRWWSLVPFTLGFYCYQGLKLLLPPIAVSLVWYDLWSQRLISFNNLFKLRWWKQQLSNLVFVLSVLILFSFYFFFQYSAQQNSQSKLSGQLLTPNSDIVVEAVQNDRRLALSTPTNKLFINKYVQWGKEVLNRYLTVFGTHELFYEVSASSSSFVVWNHGMFYLISGLLALLGCHYLLQQKKYPALVLLVSLLMISGLPSAVNERVWLFFRSAFVVPVVIILAGKGATFIWEKSRFLFMVLLIGYALAVINFGFLYFVRYPVYAAEDIFFSPRLLSDYVRRLPAQTKVLIFDDEPEFTFSSYVFYNHLFTAKNTNELQQRFDNKNYSWGNVQVRDCIPSDIDIEQSVVFIVDTTVPVCNSSDGKPAVISPEIEQKIAGRTVYIKSIKDSGTDFTIFGDSLCSDQELSTYIYPHQVSQFEFDKLSDSDFCQVWLTQAM